MVQKTDRLVTVFGGGGFLGRYVVQSLHRAGARVRIAQRDPKRAYFLKPLGGLGQTQFVRADVRDAGSARAAATGSDAVVNLVGILKGDFQSIHVEGAHNVAAAAAATGAKALVQVSSIGADPDSESAYGRSKGLGEAAARDAFAGATIVRPSILFGQEDRFINRFARMAQFAPVLPVIRGGTRFQPVWVGDAGRAVAGAALDAPRHGARTYELGGPQILTMRELMAWVCETTGRARALVEIPDPLARLIVRLTGWAPGAPMTWDQWLMLQKDNVVSPGAKGLEAFGLPKTPLAIAEAWLAAYRRHGRFAAKSPY